MENSRVIYQVDAFTNTPFRGNPAGVLLTDDRTTAAWMQNMAMEMNLSETAFLIPKGNTFKIRYFTPEKEIPLCGHATLASAHILYELGVKDKNESITFHAEGGTLTVHKDPDGIRMVFPVYPITKVTNYTGFKSSIGFEPLETYNSSLEWIIAVAPDEDTVRRAIPNYEQMIANGLGHLIITAPSNNKTIDYVERCFAPASGINEDPVTGSAQCALVPLWAQKTGKTTFNSLQVSPRTGHLKLKLNPDHTIEIKGEAITIFKAYLNIS